jgi:hypothetical protein
MTTALLFQLYVGGFLFVNLFTLVWLCTFFVAWVKNRSLGYNALHTYFCFRSSYFEGYSATDYACSAGVFFLCSFVWPLVAVFYVFKFAFWFVFLR